MKAAVAVVIVTVTVKMKENIVSATMVKESRKRRETLEM
jgi:hypothetical protein